MDVLVLVSASILIYAQFGHRLAGGPLINRSGKPKALPDAYAPEVTLVITACNQRSRLDAKVANSLAQDYPPGRIRYLFVTEGSTDGSNDYLASTYKGVVDVLGEEVQRGNVSARNHAVARVETPIVIFTDANAQLNRQAVRRLVNHFRDSAVGVVVGGKRILTEKSKPAACPGEEFYREPGSKLEGGDARPLLIPGAANELVAVRTELYKLVQADTLLDDFMISVRMAGWNHRVVYEPDAYALEQPSFTFINE